MTFRILGILNVTPDSFSDGGQYASIEKAAQRAHQLLEQGADWIDVGAESTRPGSTPISTEEEWQRLEPVLRELKDLPLSLDTANPIIMERAIDFGVQMINCTNGLVDSQTLVTLAHNKIQYIAMHRYGDSKHMQTAPLQGQSAVQHVEAFYQHAWQELHSAGFSPDSIWLDPGFGFGKDAAGQTQLMAATTKHTQKYQIVIGISRKSWIGKLLHINNPVERDNASRMLEAGLIFSGAQMIRAHDVRVLNTVREMLKG